MFQIPIFVSDQDSDSDDGKDIAEKKDSIHQINLVKQRKIPFNFFGQSWSVAKVWKRLHTNKQLLNFCITSQEHILCEERVHRAGV